MMESVMMRADDGQEIELFILEETRINGVDYILATDTPDEDGECYILRDYSDKEEEEAVYEFVEDDEELNNVLTIFAELLEDIEIEK